MRCATCRGLPSERLRSIDVEGNVDTCQDPIHDAADAAPALLEALRKAEKVLASAVHGYGTAQGFAEACDAARAALKDAGVTS